MARDEQIYVTPADVARLCGCTRRTITNHIGDGSIKAERFPGRGRRGQWKIRIEDAAEYLRIDVGEVRAALGIAMA